MTEPNWQPPLWVSDGQTVWVPTERLPNGYMRIVLCKVLVAAGNHCRVMNEARGIDKWMPLDALYVKQDDPRHPANRDMLLREILGAAQKEG